MDERLIKAIAVSFELTGTQLSDEAMEFVISALDTYPPDAVRKALERCVTTVTSKMSLAKIIEQIDDGRPGAQEAWAMLPKSEGESAAMTDDMTEAWDIVRDLLETDRIAARKSFIEAYQRILLEARSEGRPVKWFLSAGQDPAGRERAARDAVKRGLLEAADVSMYMHELPAHEEAPQLPAHDDCTEIPRGENARQLVADLKEKMGVKW